VLQVVIFLCVLLLIPRDCGGAATLTTCDGAGDQKYSQGSED